MVLCFAGKMFFERWKGYRVTRSQDISPEKGSRRPEKGDRRKDQGDWRKDQGDRRKDQGDRRKDQGDRRKDQGDRRRLCLNANMIKITSTFTDRKEPKTRYLKDLLF